MAEHVGTERGELAAVKFHKVELMSLIVDIK